MKIRRQAAATAMAATGAYAQSQYAQTVPNPTPSSTALVTAAPSTSYTTVTYSDCPSLSMESMITVTNGITVTYCPECEMASSSAQPGHTTVYATTYLSMCPTGMVPATYTVTESCTEPTPTWTPGPSHIPQGFTVTTQQCDVCETPGPVTITAPCGCEANEGTPVSTPAAATTPAASGGGSPNTPAQTTPAAAPAGSAPAGSAPAASGSAVCEYVDGQPQAGCASPNPPTSGGSAPAPSGGSSSYGAGSPPASAGSAPGTTSAPAAGSGGSAPYPTAKTATTAGPCPGPACRAAANPGNTTGIEQSTGGAASFGVLSSGIVAVVVAGFAFML